MKNGSATAPVRAVGAAPDPLAGAVPFRWWIASPAARQAWAPPLGIAAQNDPGPQVPVGWWYARLR